MASRTHNLHAARLYFGAGFIRKKQGRAAATESGVALSSASREIDAEGCDGTLRSP